MSLPSSTVFSLLQILAQPALICLSVWYYSFRALVGIPITLFWQLLLSIHSLGSKTRIEREDERKVQFFDGIVTHVRKLPMRRSFRYPLRMALVNLSNPPTWWRKKQANLHLNAKQIWERTREDVPSFVKEKDVSIHLLTSPMSFGYHQNPISVYYVVLNETGECLVNVTEVTNTPWGETVRMNFNSSKGSVQNRKGMAEPLGAHVPKSLHVSPFMDMESNWRIFVSDMPTVSKHLKLTVDCVEHPEYGDFFHAAFVAKRDESDTRGARNDYGGLRLLYRRGLSPHRIAYWIYHQAILLLWKEKATFYGPPGLDEIRKLTNEKKMHCKVSSVVRVGGGCPARIAWQPAKSWPWQT